MNDLKRPDPDLLLQSIKQEEEKQKKGRLKVFFGMAPGVGKTFAMLEVAQRISRDGVDVVAGLVETHWRIETEDLLEGLEIIPRRMVDYRGMKIGEFDLDAALARRPAVILVDELAHTNASGSRHAKRYQDVLELIDNGISVYTTLNVQHLESQMDIVERITGVKVRETIPDSVLDSADEIELVDIPPEELLKRLEEGKVYMPDRAGLAARSFFRKGNITALREMALNFVARLVDYELRDYMQKKRIRGPWKSGEHLLVAVSPSPYSEYLIRWTRRMAFTMKAPWTALYIEKRKALSEPSRELLARNLNLARQLGAEVISTADEDVVSGLLRIAREKNITQIIVGKPLRRRLADYISGGNLVERLLKASGDSEIHIVTQPDLKGKPPRFATGISRPPEVRDYLVSLASVAGVTLVNLLLVRVTGYWTIALVYLLGVTLMALFIGRGPVLLAAGLSALLWNYLFIPPLFTFRIDREEDALMLGMYFIIAIILGGLTTRIRTKEWALRTREKRITALYEFSRELGTALSLDDVVHVAVRYIEEYFHAKAAVIMADDTGRLSPVPHKSGSFPLSVKEHAIAEWSFKNRQPAGLFTQTLPQAEAYYVPLIAPGRVVGILGIRPATEKVNSLEQEEFLQNICYQLSVRIERENLSVLGQQARLMAESERLYHILLNSISHELRTPLTTITGASSSLLDEVVQARPEIRTDLAREIKKASERLNRLVDNLLDMSRLESGMITLNRQSYDAGDLVSVVLRRLGDELTTHAVLVDVPDGLPMVRMDFTLMEQVLTNLVYNAVLYTPSGTNISVVVFLKDGAVNFAVRDNGPGLEPEEIPFLFDKFRRGPRAPAGGTGLGLSICRGIVEAHGGKITAGNNPGGGAEFIVALPAAEDPGRTREEGDP